MVLYVRNSHLLGALLDLIIIAAVLFYLIHTEEIAVLFTIFFFTILGLIRRTSIFIIIIDLLFIVKTVVVFVNGRLATSSFALILE